MSVRDRCRPRFIALGLLLAATLGTMAPRAQSSGPEVSYAFNETTGSLAADASGNTHDGTVAGAAWASGRYDGGLAFDGIDDYVEVGSGDPLQLTTAFTFEAWIRPTASTPHTILHKEGTSTYTFEVGADGIAHAGGSFNGTNADVYSPIEVPLGEWTHLAATYDGAALRLYVNGALVDATSATGALPVSSQPLLIGGMLSGRTVSGSLDEVRIYGRALSAFEIALDMLTPIDPATPFQVTGRTPAADALGVLGPVSATFSRAIEPATLTTSTFELTDETNSIVSASVSYDAVNRRATLTPSAALTPLTAYTARVVGGSSGVLDTSSSLLPADLTWTFTTAGSSAVPSAAFAFGEPSGTTTADDSGNGNVGQLRNGAARAGGYFGTGLLFDGDDDVVRVAASDTLALTSGLTFEVWVNPSLTASQTLVSQDGAYVFEVRGDNGRARMAGYFDTVYADVSSQTVVPPDVWTHLATTYDGTTLRLYVNGIEEGATAIIGSLPDSVQPLTIGGRLVSGDTIAGSVDEVRIYRRALSQAEIAADMSTPIDDTLAPTVVFTAPVAGATGVDPSVNVLVGFSESMDVASITSTAVELIAGGVAVPAVVSYNDATSVATIDPVSQLAYGATYTLTVYGGTAGPADRAGNSVLATYTSSFTVTAPPLTITGRTPQAGAINVPSASIVQITFSNDLVAATLTPNTIQLRDSAGTTLAASVTYDATTSTATLTPAATLVTTRMYTVIVLGGSTSPRVQDIYGGALSSDASWSFVVQTSPVRIASYFHTLAVDDSGQVWAWGRNALGERGYNGEGRVPRVVSGATGVVSVAAGAGHSLALTSGGTVLAWGGEYYGELGNDQVISGQASPVAVATISGIVAVAAGSGYSVALKSDGTVWAWGLATRVGDGQATTNRRTPVPVPSLSGIVAISATKDHTLALKSDGTVWAWGDNVFGRLGNNTTTASLVPVQAQGITDAVAIAAGDSHSLALRANGTILGWGLNSSSQLGDNGSNRLVPTAIAGIANVANISAGVAHSAAVLTDGMVQTWGANGYRQLGIGSSASNALPQVIAGLYGIAGIAAGPYHTSVWSTTGVVHSWGRNDLGLLGDGTYVQRDPPVSISVENFLWKTGTPLFSVPSGTYSVTKDLTLTTATAGGTVRYTTDGSEPTDASTPASGTIVVDRTQTVKARAFHATFAGSSPASETYTFQVATPTHNPSGGTFTSNPTVTISSSAGATIYYTTDGSTPDLASTVYAAPLPITYPVTLKTKAYRDGWVPSAITTAAYSVSNYTPGPSQAYPGAGDYDGPVTVVLVPPQPDQIVKYSLTSADPATTFTQPLLFTKTTTLKYQTWFRQPNNQWTMGPIQVATFVVRVRQPAIDLPPGDHDPGTVIRITTSTPGALLRYRLDGQDPGDSDPIVPPDGKLMVGNFTLKVRGYFGEMDSSIVSGSTYTVSSSYSQGAVAGGQHHSLALSPDGVVWAWGRNDRRQLGYGERWGPTFGILAAPSFATPQAAGVTGVTAIAAGQNFNVALRHGGRVLTWGFMLAGALGRDSCRVPWALEGGCIRPEDIGLAEIIAVSAGNYHALALAANGQVWSWGSNDEGELGTGAVGGTRTAPGLVAGLTDVVQIASGGDHNLALRSDGTVWGWGSYYHSAVGDGSGQNQPLPVQVMTGAVAIATGLNHSMARTADGTLWVWGTGGLGLGDNYPRYVPTPNTAVGAIVGMSGGGNFTVVVTASGSVLGFGDNTDGQLGDGLPAAVLSPVELQDSFGDVRTMGAGWNHRLTMGDDGNAWVSGLDEYGQVGDGTIGGIVPLSVEVFDENTFEVVDLAEGSDAEDTLYYHTDVIGSVRMMTTRSGSIQARYDFLPDGRELLGTSADRLQFAGKERDQETATAGWQAFDYFGARYYQSQTGRFTSPDPLMTLEENLFDPQRWNRYSYVRNNPLRYTDPDGRTLVKLGITLAKVVYKGGDVYSTVEGIVESVKTIADSQSTWAERGVAGAQLVGELTGVSDLLKGGKTVLNAVENVSGLTKRIPNPHGQLGKPDHQETVKRLVQRAQDEFPEGVVRQSLSIATDTGLNRRPDVSVRDASGRLLRVYEAARKNRSGQFVPRERKKKREYDAYGLESVFEEVAP